MLGVKMITPRAFHDAPRPSGASQRTCTGPPASAAFFNFPAEKKPMYLLSGDQKGNVASSTSSIWRTVPEFTSRIHNLVAPGSPVRKASLEPSGESAGGPAATEANSISLGGSQDAVIGRRASASWARLNKKIARP